MRCLYAAAPWLAASCGDSTGARFLQACSTCSKLGRTCVGTARRAVSTAMMGGLPFPVCTPAHGTAYDIAGQGVANVGATREALLLAARMAATAIAKAN